VNSDLEEEIADTFECEAARITGANGVMAVGVPYPAVSRKQTRIRMNVTSEMTKEQLDKGYEALCNAIQQSKLEETIIA